MFRLFFIAILGIPGISSQNTYSTVDGLPGCPCSLTFVNNLDKDRLGGDWYVQYLSNPTIGGCNGDCWTLNLSKRNSTFTAVEFCCNKNGIRYCEADIGSGSITDPPCFPGQLTYETSGFGFPAFIPDVQYDRYLVGLFCALDPNGHPIQSLYIFTRDPVICPSVRDETFAILRRNGVDPKTAIFIPRGPQCPSKGC